MSPRRAGARARASALAGFTLVEGLVVPALLGLVLMVLWQALLHGLKREARLDFRLRAIQTAALTLARLGDDFTQLVPLRPRPGQREIAAGLVFDRISSTARSGPGGTPLNAGGAPVLQSVTYRHDPQRHVFLRDGQVLASGMIHDMELTYETSAGDGYSVRVDMDLVPEAEVGRPEPPSKKAEFGFSFYSPQGSRAMAADSWVGDT